MGLLRKNGAFLWLFRRDVKFSFPFTMSPFEFRIKNIIPKKRQLNTMPQPKNTVFISSTKWRLFSTSPEKTTSLATTSKIYQIRLFWSKECIPLPFCNENKMKLQWKGRQCGRIWLLRHPVYNMLNYPWSIFVCLWMW